MRSHRVCQALLLTAAFMFGGSSHAADLITDDAGYLIGFDNLRLTGLGDYGVRFVDGACEAAYLECTNERFLFAFQPESAGAAAAALGIAVQQFELPPIRGCEGAALCRSVTPYERMTSYIFDAPLNVWLAGLVGGGNSNQTHPLTLYKSEPQIGWSEVWAVWTPNNPVPEPSTYGLLLAGLLAVATRGRWAGKPSRR